MVQRVAAFRFSAESRREIERILTSGFRDGTPESLLSTDWVRYIEDAFAKTAADAARAEERWREIVTEKRLRRKSGRPYAERSRLVDLYVVALVYRGCTGREIRKSRTGEFYRLAQICLNYADPLELVGQLLRTEWLDRIIEDLDLQSARQVVCRAAAKVFAMGDLPGAEQ